VKNSKTKIEVAGVFRINDDGDEGEDKRQSSNNERHAGKPQGMA